MLASGVLTWPRLLEIQAASLSGIGHTLWVWLSSAASPSVGLHGWLVAVALIAAGGSLYAGYRHLGQRSRTIAGGAALVGALVLVLMGWSSVRARTLSDASEQHQALQELAERAARETPEVQYNLLLEYARLRAATGQSAEALSRYEQAFDIGLGSRSVREYLRLSIETEGAQAARRRLDQLMQRYPGHPVLMGLSQE